MADAAGLGFKVWGRDSLNQLVRDGAELRVYHPVNTRFTRLLEGGGYAQNHDNILVVDGQHGITGGRNIGGACYSDPKDVPTAWHDTDVVLDGKGAVGGEELVHNLELAGGARRAPAPTRQAVDARILDRTSARVDAHDEFAAALIQTADSAQKRLLIQNPYVVLTKPMLEALERAARRGVQIAIVTNSPNSIDSTDSAVTQAFFLRDWPEIMARLDGAKLFVFGGARKMHPRPLGPAAALTPVTTS